MTLRSIYLYKYKHRSVQFNSELLKLTLKAYKSLQKTDPFLHWKMLMRFLTILRLFRHKIIIIRKYLVI